MSREITKSVSDRLNEWSPVLISEQSLNISGVQNEKTVEAMLSSAFTIQAAELLYLDDESIYELCKLIRKKLTSFGQKVNREDLRQLKPGSHNSLIHEKSHLEAIVELRPELLQDTKINIIFVEKADGQLFVAMNNMTPIPEEEYTVSEKVKILLAPDFPSWSDYLGLVVFLNMVSASSQDLREIIRVADAKPKSLAKDKFLEELNSRVES